MRTIQSGLACLLGLLLLLLVIPFSGADPTKNPAGTSAGKKKPSSAKKGSGKKATDSSKKRAMTSKKDKSKGHSHKGSGRKGGKGASPTGKSTSPSGRRILELVRQLERTKEWELSASVVRGRVRTRRSIDHEGRDASSGPRFVVTMTVDKVLKGPALKAKETLHLEGWADGKERQLYIPPVGEDVLAFLAKSRGAQRQLLFPSGFKSTRPLLAPPPRRAP
jgi:hypothetical protein